MPKLKMTDAAVRSTTVEPGKRIDYFDDHPRDRQRGLALRSTGSRDANGVARVSRIWYALYRIWGKGKLHRFKIGEYPGTSLGEARARCGRIVTDARQSGVNPQQERKEAERQAEIVSRDTMQAVIDAYLSDLKKQPKKKGGLRAPRYVEGTRANFTNHVLPRWGALNIREITRRDVNDLLRAVADEGSKVKDAAGKRRVVPGGNTASRRTYSGIRAMFGYAVRQGIIDVSPALMVEPPGQETARDRTLAADEIRIIWDAADGLPYPFGPFFRLALILGQRRNEIACMRWSDVDLEAKTWTLAAEGTKARRGHVVPLPPLAVDIINGLPRKAVTSEKTTRPSPYLLTSSGAAPVSGFSKAKPALDRAVTKARDGKPLPYWVIHDLRRTAATEMARLGATEFVVARVLNHAAVGVTGKHYNQYDYLQEKRHALEAWASYIEGLAAPAGDKVISIKKAASR